jgi:uncharacterized integral membrane protein (TIGR00698 family)
MSSLESSVSASAVQTAQAAPRAASFIAQARTLAPGVLATAAIAGAAFALRNLPGVAVVSPLMLSIVLGMAVRNTVGAPAWARPGAAFSMRRLLRLGIILLGLQLTLTQVAQVGLAGVAIIALGLVATFVVTVRLGRLLGVDAKLAELIAAGTSICGASAVIATNTVTRAPDEDAAYAVACVTIFGGVAMAVYPLLAIPLDLDPRRYGLWSGASIHEIAQVTAAAFQRGPQAGEIGTVSKLTRVMMLAPMVMGLGALAARRSKAGDGPKAKAPLPWFVLGFIALIGLNSIAPLPTTWTPSAKLLTTFLLSMALAAMGLDADLRKLAAKGPRPLLLGLAASVFISGFSLILVKLFA